MSVVYVTEHGAKLAKDGGKFVLTKDDKILYEIPAATLEGVILIETVQVSSQAMVELLKRNIPLTWIAKTGKSYGALQSFENTNVLKQRQQITQQESPFALALGKKIITAKIHNQQSLLRRYNRTAENAAVMEAITILGTLKPCVSEAENRNEIMGFEGIAAKTYFAAIGQMIRPEFAFTKRTKRPPTDPFNAMISFGYTLLMHEIYAALMNEGLNPYFGFLHALRNHHPALASDLMEPWRPVLIDAMVWTLIQKQSISPACFYQAKTGKGTYLTKEGRKQFLQAYEKKLRAMNSYDDTLYSYRYSLGAHVRKYTTALMNEDIDAYHPIIVRG